MSTDMMQFDMQELLPDATDSETKKHCVKNFLNSRFNLQKSFVHSVFSAHGTEVSSLPKVIRAHKHFYSTLVAEEPVDLTVRDNLLSFVTHRLSDVDQEICEGVLLLDEATEALILSNRNKTPGPDRLSVEFYLAFSSPSSKDFQ